MSIISSRFTRPVWLALGLAASLGAHAQGGLADAQQARVDNRQERQETRIDQGVATGELTRRETARLVASWSTTEADVDQLIGMLDQALTELLAIPGARL